MRVRPAIFALSIALATCSGVIPPAWAQADNEVVTEPAPPASAAPRDPTSMIGSWEFSNADRDKICTLTFKPDRTTVGQKVEFDRACVSTFPFMREVAGWTRNENELLKLSDAKGNPLLEFSEVENGMFEAPRPGEGILFLQSAAAADPPPRSAQEMAGEWSVVRGAGKPICVLTLTATAAGSDAYQVRVKPGCDPAVARLGASSWQMDRAELVLRGARNQVWRFEEGADRKWQRVPETADQYVLLKQ